MVMPISHKIQCVGYKLHLQRNMGDSSPCVMMQPFCYASGFSHEDSKSTSNYALGQSVSFGRFMSESLEWDKWSSFSNNRYVEEAERFSRPGSVAEKKAFFEAHYKKLAAQKAAALLEQANSASQTEQEQETEVDNSNNHDSEITSPKSKLVFNEENAKVLHPESDATRYNSNSNSNSNSVLVALQNQLEDVDTHKDPSENVRGKSPLDTPKLKEGSNHDHEVLLSVGKKKASVSSFKFWKGIGTSKFISTPVKSITPIISNGENIAIPVSNEPASSSVDKKRLIAKSSHMSLNFTLVKEINRLSASVMRKFESTRVGAGSSKDSKDSSSPLRTPNKASKKELPKHSSYIPLTEENRDKMKSPIISSPFRLRTEERAAIRKKKLEKQIDASGAQKAQLHIKLKEKAQIKIKKLRRSFCFSAGPLPDFYKEREESKRGNKEDPLTPPESPKLGITPSPIVVEGKISSFPKRFFHEKNGIGSLAQPLTSNSTVILTHENTSLNIQIGNQPE
ncbi:protein WVD2-like 7 isoform X2 [Lotus japonicus]|uniref:protein WVD2-like 7 isoform X2 n=1 Tax=Lotus japonicus TaxID=34305 RepID=UPI00258A6B69|nr:protein WVD2-like 7 isoform X2 [Lotus japonicus]